MAARGLLDETRSRKWKKRLKKPHPERGEPHVEDDLCRFADDLLRRSRELTPPLLTRVDPFVTSRTV
jgi:hypothetical protein